MRFKLGNKKGIAYSTVMKIPDMLFLVVAFLVVWLLLGLHVKSDVETFSVESDIAAIRILYDSLAYHDPDTGRIHPGIIDTNKLNTNYLEQVYDQPNKYMPIKISFNDKLAFIDEENFKDYYAARFVKKIGKINIKEIKLFTLTEIGEEGVTELIITQKAK